MSTEESSIIRSALVSLGGMDSMPQSSIGELETNLLSEREGDGLGNVDEVQVEDTDVIESIQHGKTLNLHNNIKLQAHSAAISCIYDVELVLQDLRKLPQVTNGQLVFAYRLEDAMNFEDGGIEGAGEKLLLLLYKMQVVDVMIAVSIFKGHFVNQGAGIYKLILDTAKQLLEELKNEIMEAEDKMGFHPPHGEAKGGGLVNISPGNLKARLFSYSNLPRIKQPELEPNKDPENIIQGEDLELLDKTSILGPSIEYEPSILQSTFLHSLNEAKEGIVRIKKTDIVELKSQHRPHYLVEQIGNIWCIFKGIIPPKWEIAQQLLNPVTYKKDLMNIFPHKFTSQQRSKLSVILNKHKALQSPKILKTVSPAGGALLEWMIHMVNISRGWRQHAGKITPEIAHNNPYVPAACTPQPSYQSHFHQINPQLEITEIAENNSQVSGSGSPPPTQYPNNIYTMKIINKQATSPPPPSTQKTSNITSLRQIHKGDKVIQGHYIKSKNLVLQEENVLVPSHLFYLDRLKKIMEKKARDNIRIKVPMSTETLPECEVEVPDMDYSNFERTTLANMLGKEVPPHLESHVAGMYEHAIKASSYANKESLPAPPVAKSPDHMSQRSILESITPIHQQAKPKPIKTRVRFPPTHTPNKGGKLISGDSASAKWGKSPESLESGGVNMWSDQSEGEFANLDELTTQNLLDLANQLRDKRLNMYPDQAICPDH